MNMLALLLQDPNIDPNQVAKAMAIAGPLIFIGLLLFFAIAFVLPLWFAFKKAGLPPALALIALIPTFGAIICLFILAFSTWRVVPAPAYGTTYPPPPPGYPGQGYMPQQAGFAPSPADYSAQPVSYAPTSTAPVYPPPSDPRTDV